MLDCNVTRAVNLSTATCVRCLPKHSSAGPLLSLLLAGQHGLLNRVDQVHVRSVDASEACAQFPRLRRIDVVVNESNIADAIFAHDNDRIRWTFHVRCAFLVCNFLQRRE